MTSPHSLLVMRHAEKPDDPDDRNLSPAGLARAARLATYLPGLYGHIDHLIAAAPSKHSSRPVQTLDPLAHALALPVDASIADQNYAFLAQALRADPRYDGKLIVVCWHHGNIPSLLHALGASHGDYPDPWDRDVFNLILQVDCSSVPCAVTQHREPF